MHVLPSGTGDGYGEFLSQMFAGAAASAADCEHRRLGGGAGGYYGGSTSRILRREGYAAALRRYGRGVTRPARCVEEKTA